MSEVRKGRKGLGTVKKFFLVLGTMVVLETWLYTQCLVAVRVSFTLGAPSCVATHDIFTVCSCLLQKCHLKMSYHPPIKRQRLEHNSESEEPPLSVPGEKTVHVAITPR